MPLRTAGRLLEARYRRWMEAGPAYEAGDLERLRGFRPQVRPLVVWVRLALAERLEGLFRV